MPSIATSPSTTGSKISWKVFWDLQCPFSKRNWQLLPDIRQQFGAEYDFSIHLTSLAFHPQSFTAQCGAHLIETYRGREGLLQYVDACFANQDKYMNTALGDARKSDILEIFANIAEEAGLLGDKELTRDVFLKEINDWEKAIKPAWVEHKNAMGYAVYGTPKQVIDEELVLDTESAWGPDEWAEKLKELKKVPMEFSCV